MSKTLTIYYSRKGENYFPEGIQSITKGNTEYAAEFVQEAMGGDLFEIDTVEPYAEDYRQCCARAAAEWRANERPAIKAYLDDILQYDRIFVCYPNWCGTVPMCILTFLEHYDLTGKTIIPLCTSEGTGLGESENALRTACKGASVLPGLHVFGHEAASSRETIMNWAKGC